MQDIRDLHVWSITITSGVPMLSFHLTIEKDGVHDTVLHSAQTILHDQFGLTILPFRLKNQSMAALVSTAPAVNIKKWI